MLANEPLRATLEDLRAAESKGKWWLVGAAWGGDPLVDRMDNVVPSAQPKENSINDNALLKLAKKQGMNTDVRRSIFVVLMGSDVRQVHLHRISQQALILLPGFCRRMRTPCAAQSQGSATAGDRSCVIALLR